MAKNNKKELDEKNVEQVSGGYLPFGAVPTPFTQAYDAYNKKDLIVGREPKHELSDEMSARVADLEAKLPKGVQTDLEFYKTGYYGK